MEHYIYKITNMINGKYYYGKRSCKGLAINDTYMGSGKLIKHAIKKYSNENFKKEILAYCESSKDALELEEMVVTDIEVNDYQCYNMIRGGKGCKGLKHAEETKIKISSSLIGEKNPFFGKIHSDDTKQKMSNSLKGRQAHNKGKSMSEEARKKLSEARKGIAPYNKGKPMSEEQRKKISEAKKGMEATNKGIPHSEETRRKMSATKLKNKLLHSNNIIDCSIVDERVEHHFN